MRTRTAQVVGNEHERSEWKSPPSIADLYSGARSRVFDSSLFNADLAAWVSVRVARDTLSAQAVYLFFFFKVLTCEIWFFGFVLLLKSFVLYFSGFFIGSRSVGHREIWRPIRIFSVAFVRRKGVHHHSATPRVASFSRQGKSPFLRLCRESVSLDPRQLTPRTVLGVHTCACVCVCVWYVPFSLDGYC